ncbi:hypothetical protein [Pseudanabaena sp. PCC 6802]|uniref:hypothetical protein n=1 Tax=Pseudanabaena sp. PCC 6802 TaxID=118173 RepID=UPI00038135C0|nr:hypothetical protein [Pseudanabaena sp. PCC 6802]
MQFIDAKQAYPLILGMVISLVGVGLWQKLNPPTVREITSPLPVTVPPLPTTSPRPARIPGKQQGALRVGNRTEHSVRIVLLSGKRDRASWDGVEPVNWDFAPSEGGAEGLLLSLPNGQIEVAQGDIMFAFATDGSRLYWGPHVVGQTNSLVWNGDRREWNMILEP